ncbi:hypothetical protein [Desulfitobacterium dehalogenans]|uniref:hypothetical protein n=1 Tax=Desulfitobacterium dehalogenans TaxID=36854 RepID=UPI0006805A6C|nr:hypothetical protein [Desulfitobacterium dehalogenans]
MRKATLTDFLFDSFLGSFFKVTIHAAGWHQQHENGSGQVACPTSAPLKPEKQPKDFALRQRTDSKRAGKQSSRKDCSGVGLETGRFQPPIENKCESSAFEERFGHESRIRVSPKPPQRLLSGAGGPGAAEVLSD